MSAYQLADAVAAWERLAGWVNAKQAEAAAELTRREEITAGRDTTGVQYAALAPVPVAAGDVCTVWPWTKPQAEHLIAYAVDLTDRFGPTHQALVEGRLDTRRARIIIDELRNHKTHVIDVVQAAVLPHVHAWTSVKTRLVVRRLIHELAPDTAQQRHRAAREQRDVWTEPAADGMAWLHALLPAEQAAAIMAALNAAANSEKGHDCTHGHTCTCPSADSSARATSDDTSGTGGRTDDGDGTGDTESAADTDSSDAGGACASRTMGQRRADALAAMAWASLTTGHLGGTGCANCGSPFGTPLARAHGRPVAVNMTMSLATWIGLNNHPAHLDGYGPIDAHTARHLASAGVWRWVRTDPTGGHALDYGRTRYTPPQDLTDFILLRDQECIMPGCHHPAWRCEIDHRIPYPHGPTSACNCSALCKPCHLQKTHAGWKLERLRPGVQRWTSPTGHQQVVRLPRIAPSLPEPKPPGTDGPLSDPPLSDPPPY